MTQKIFTASEIINCNNDNTNEYCKVITKAKNIIFKEYPKLIFAGQILIEEYENFGLKSALVEIPDNEKGHFFKGDNIIYISEYCFEQYMSGNKILLYRVLTHELIHASGILDESETVLKTEEYINKLKDIIFLKG